MELKRPPRPREEPPGLDAFVGGVKTTPTIVHVVQQRTAETSTPKSAIKPMNIRFSPAAKAALEFLAQRDRRSQNQVLTLLVEPMLIAEAERLGWKP
jgi:hypothetical protein